MTKAKYYVELFHVNAGVWLRQGHVPGKQRCLEFGRWLSKSYPMWPVRVRYRGRVIAKWVNGKRVA